MKWVLRLIGLAVAVLVVVFLYQGIVECFDTSAAQSLFGKMADCG